MLILYAARIHCSFLHLQLTSVSMFHLVLHVAPACTRAGLTTTVQTHRPTESLPSPASHHATNIVSLPNDICHGAVPRPSSSLARRRPYGCPLCAEVCLLSGTRYVALPFAIAKATLCPLHSTLRTLRQMSTRCRNQFSGLR